MWPEERELATFCPVLGAGCAHLLSSPWDKWAGGLGGGNGEGSPPGLTMLGLLRGKEAALSMWGLVDPRSRSCPLSTGNSQEEELNSDGEEEGHASVAGDAVGLTPYRLATNHMYESSHLLITSEQATSPDSPVNEVRAFA